MRQSAESAYLDYLFDYFQGLYPELYPLDSAPEFRARLKRILATARSYGFTERRSALVFIWITLTLGEAFEREPDYFWTTSILRSSRLPQQCKVAWLVRGLDCGFPTGLA